MRATDRRRRGCGLLLALALVGCASSPAPRGWLSPALEAQSDPYGAWIVVSRFGAEASVAGEFLAVDRDSVFVLTPDSVIHRIPADSVRVADLAFYDARWGSLAAWTGIGAASTISNGFVLLLTLPTWVIGGSIATSLHSLDPLRRVERTGDWDAVRQFARFPRGMPADLPAVLPPKPAP